MTTRDNAEKQAATTDVIQNNELTVETIDNHVYFYSTVNSDRCLALIREIRMLDVRLRTEHESRMLPAGFQSQPIWLHINSGGGFLFDGLGVADQLTQIRTPIFSVVEGYAASAATLLSMSCTRRYILPSSFMLIHQLSAISWGTYEQIKDEMKLLDMAMERLTAFYGEKTKMADAEIRELLKHDSWFNATECIERGLVDEVLTG